MGALRDGQCGAGQLIEGLASVGGVMLVWTGLALVWRRFFAWRSCRAASRGAGAPLPEDAEATVD